MMAFLKALCDGASAIFAILAAFAWFKAASAPLPWFAWAEKTAASTKGAGDPDEFSASLAMNRGAEKGAVWNRRAAIFAGVSAAFQSISLIISLLTEVEKICQ